MSPIGRPSARTRPVAGIPAPRADARTIRISLWWTARASRTRRWAATSGSSEPRCARSHRAWRFCLGSKRRRSVETQTRPSKKRSTIMRSRPAAALAPRSADVEALPQAPESLSHVLAESPRVQMKVTHSLVIDSSATACSLTLTFFSLTVFVVGPVSLGPRRQASGASKAERRDADEAVKEAIDDHAEPTGCCPGPAVRRRGSLPPAPRNPAPCPARVAPRPNEGHPLSSNRLQRDCFLTHSHFSLSHSLCGWSRESRAASPGLRRLEARALKLLTTAAYQLVDMLTTYTCHLYVISYHNRNLSSVARYILTIYIQ